jgi:hypothetical protein
MRRDAAIEMGNATQRKIISLDPIREGKLTEFRHQRPMAAHDPLDQAKV